MPLPIDPAAIPEHLPGEPPDPTLRGGLLLIAVIAYAGFVAVLGTALLPLWVPYLVLAARYGRPPVVPRGEQVRRYLRLAWTVDPPAPGLTPLRRAWLSLAVLRKLATTPLWGLAWLVDELLYGRALDAVEVRAPLFEISAARSGSTQLARYLEDDPSLAAPSVLQSLFPYVWLWRVVGATLGRVVTRDQVHRWVEAMLPPEFVERHEGDPFRTDTYEAALFLCHLNALSLFLGPEVAVGEFGAGVLHDDTRALWEDDFVRLLDRTGRKRLWTAGPAPDGGPRRLFVKGHFLAAAPALARRFPDARFLAMVRSPGERVRSAINYLRVNPLDRVLGPPPWPWLAETLVRTEVAYNEAERAWFGAPDGPVRCVVRFEDYVRDLRGTVTRIYAECLGTSLPPHVPTAHPPRRRHDYAVDRPLGQLGIDAAALDERLAGYRAWQRGVGPSPASGGA